MPANNIKAFTDDELQQLNDKYKVTYSPHANTILVELSTCKRKTTHTAGQPFAIRSKQNPRRKIGFGISVVTMWQEFQDDERMKKYTIFDVQNAFTKLKLMYQPTTKQKVIELLTKGFFGIKRI